MIDSKYEQLLFSVCKSLIASETLLTKIELYRDVTNSMVNLFGETEPIRKLNICGKEEDFADSLNFCLIVLIELGLIQQKEVPSLTNSYNSSTTVDSYKWNGIKGFTKKYLATNGLIASSQLYEDINSFEKQIQIFTRIFLCYLIVGYNNSIDLEFTSHLTEKCNLVGQENQVDKIIATLLFTYFISTQEQSLTLNIELFNYSAEGLVNPKNIMEEQKLRPLFTEPEQFNKYHNDLINKRISIWEELITNVQGERERKHKEKLMMKNKKYDKNNNTNNNNTTQGSNYNSKITLNLNNSVNNNNINENNDDISEKIAENLVSTVDKVKEKLQESGFALLKGKDFSYYMKELSCIIGRSPYNSNNKASERKNYENENITWDVDLNLGNHKKISKQHALIAFNFEDSCFEIKNLSKKYKLLVNEEEVYPGEELPLSSKSVITIGNKDIIFLLPN